MYVYMYVFTCMCVYVCVSIGMHVCTRVLVCIYASIQEHDNLFQKTYQVPK